LTVLFRQKNYSSEDSIALSFANIKEKLEQFKEEENK